MDQTPSIKCPKCSGSFATEETRTSELLSRVQAIESQLQVIVNILEDRKQPKPTSSLAPNQGQPWNCPHLDCSSKPPYRHLQSLRRHFKIHTPCPEPCPASCNHPFPMVKNAWDHKCPGLSLDAKTEWRKQMWRATKKALRGQWSNRHGSAMPTTGWGDSASDSSSVEGNQKRRKGTTDVANSSTKRRRILPAKDNAPFHPHESDHTEEASPSSESPHQNGLHILDSSTMANTLPAWWNDRDLIMDQTARTFREEELQFQFLNVTSNQIPTVTDSFPTQHTYPPPPPQVTTQQQHHHTSSFS